jgi:hypothetical protein
VKIKKENDGVSFNNVLIQILKTKIIGFKTKKKQLNPNKIYYIYVNENKIRSVIMKANFYFCFITLISANAHSLAHKCTQIILHTSIKIIIK